MVISILVEHRLPAVGEGNRIPVSQKVICELSSLLRQEFCCW